MDCITKKVLITVKTYPNPSKKYGETVCCAGIDIETSQWIRLYPIPFRDLDFSKRFKKYAIIKVECSKAPKDHRIESFKVDSDSIKIIEQLDTNNNWQRRKEIVIPTASKSLCHLLNEVQNDKSLGMFKPTDVSFSFKKAGTKDKEKRQACYAQLSFFNRQKTPIEDIPIDFYYHFKCHGQTDCPGHKLLILDWEIVQAYRDWRSRYPSESELLEKIEQRWMEMTSAKKDTYFYVGNMQRFKNQFMVLGVFYPPL